MGRDIMDFGKPTADTCRWCDRPRHRNHLGALACIPCDWMPRWPKPQPTAA